MVKAMTPDEWEALFGTQKPKAVRASRDNGSNGHAELKDSVGFIAADPGDEITDEELELIAEQTVAGYDKKFVKEDWQTLDIFHLLRYHDKAHEKSKVTGSANWSEMGSISGDAEVINWL